MTIFIRYEPPVFLSAKDIFSQKAETLPVLRPFDPSHPPAPQLISTLATLGMLSQGSLRLTFQPWENLSHPLQEASLKRLERVMQLPVFSQLTLKEFLKNLSQFLRARIGVSFSVYLGDEIENYICDHTLELEPMIQECLRARAWPLDLVNRELYLLKKYWEAIPMPKGISLFLLLPAHAPRPNPDLIKQVSLEFLKNHIQLSESDLTRTELSEKSILVKDSYFRFSFYTGFEGLFFQCVIGKQTETSIFSRYSHLLPLNDYLNNSGKKNPTICPRISSPQAVLDSALHIVRYQEKHLSVSEVAPSIMRAMMQGHSIVEEGASGVKYAISAKALLDYAHEGLDFLINLFIQESNDPTKRESIEEKYQKALEVIKPRSGLSQVILHSLQEKKISWQGLSQELHQVALLLCIYGLPPSHSNPARVLWAKQGNDYLTLQIENLSFVFPPLFRSTAKPWTCLAIDLSQLQAKNDSLPLWLEMNMDTYIQENETINKHFFFLLVGVQKKATPLSPIILKLLPEVLLTAQEQESKALAALLQPWFAEFTHPNHLVSWTLTLLGSVYEKIGIRLLHLALQKLDEQSREAYFKALILRINLQDLLRYLTNDISNDQSLFYLKTTLSRVMKEDLSTIRKIIEETPLPSALFGDGNIQRIITQFFEKKISSSSIAELESLFNLLPLFICFIPDQAKIYSLFLKRSSSLSFKEKSRASPFFIILIRGCFESKIYLNRELSIPLLSFLLSLSKIKALNCEIQKLLAVHHEEFLQAFDFTAHETQLLTLIKVFQIKIRPMEPFPKKMMSRAIQSLTETKQTNSVDQFDSLLKKFELIIAIADKQSFINQSLPVLIDSPRCFLAFLKWVWKKEFIDREKLAEEVQTSFLTQIEPWPSQHLLEYLTILASDQKTYSFLYQLLPSAIKRCKETDGEQLIRLVLTSRFSQVNSIISLMQQDGHSHLDELLSMVEEEHSHAQDIDISDVLNHLNNHPQLFLKLLNWLCSLPYLSKKAIAEYVQSIYASALPSWPALIHFQCLYCLAQHQDVWPTLHKLIPAAIQRLEKREGSLKLLIKVLISSRYSNLDESLKLFILIGNECGSFLREINYLLRILRINNPPYSLSWKEVVNFFIQNKGLHSLLFHFFNKETLINIYKDEHSDFWKVKGQAMLLDYLSTKPSADYVEKILQFRETITTEYGDIDSEIAKWLIELKNPQMLVEAIEIFKVHFNKHRELLIMSLTQSSRNNGSIVKQEDGRKTYTIFLRILTALAEQEWPETLTNEDISAWVDVFNDDLQKDDHYEFVILAYLKSQRSALYERTLLFCLTMLTSSPSLSSSFYTVVTVVLNTLPQNMSWKCYQHAYAIFQHPLVIENIETIKLGIVRLHILENFLRFQPSQDHQLQLNCFLKDVNLINSFKSKRKEEFWALANDLLLQQLQYQPTVPSFCSSLYRLIQGRLGSYENLTQETQSNDQIDSNIYSLIENPASDEPVSQYLLELLNLFREMAPQNVQARSCLIITLVEYLELFISSRKNSSYYHKLIHEVIYECLGLERSEKQEKPFLRRAKAILTALKTQGWFKENDPTLNEYNIVVELVLTGEISKPLKRAFENLAKFHSPYCLTALCGLIKSFIHCQGLGVKNDLRGYFTILLEFMKNYSYNEPSTLSETMKFIYDECFACLSDSLSSEWKELTREIQKQRFPIFFSIAQKLYEQHPDQRKPSLIALLKILLSGTHAELIDTQKAVDELKKLGKDRNERNAALCQVIFELSQSDNKDHIEIAKILLGRLSPDEKDTQDYLGIGRELYEKIQKDCEHLSD